MGWPRRGRINTENHGSGVINLCYMHTHAPRRRADEQGASVKGSQRRQMLHQAHTHTRLLVSLSNLSPLYCPISFWAWSVKPNINCLNSSHPDKHNSLIPPPSLLLHSPWTPDLKLFHIPIVAAIIVIISWRITDSETNSLTVSFLGIMPAFLLCWRNIITTKSSSNEDHTKTKGLQQDWGFSNTPTVSAGDSLEPP